LQVKVAAPGEVKIVCRGKVVAAAALAPGDGDVTARFRPPSPWNVQLRYEGTAPLDITDVAVFPYPWKEAD
jgi:hypothetical protein